MCPDSKGKCHAPGSKEKYECFLAEDLKSDKCSCEKDEVWGIANVAVEEYTSSDSAVVDTLTFKLQEAEVRGNKEKVVPAQAVQEKVH